MSNPEKIEIAGLKTIHKLCKFGADHNMEGCTFTEIVERMFDELAKAQAVPNAQQALHDRLLVKSIREHVEGHISEISVNDLFDKGCLAAMKCIQNNIDMLEAQEPTND